MCDKCSTKRMLIKNSQKKEQQRVCDRCVAEITDKHATTASSASSSSVTANSKDNNTSIESTIMVDESVMQESVMYGDDEYDDTDYSSATMTAPLSPRSLSTLAAQSVVQCRAVYPYAAAEPSDLSFPEGAIITILHKDESGWWRGMYNDAEGLFPANYVLELGTCIYSSASHHT